MTLCLLSASMRRPLSPAVQGPDVPELRLMLAAFVGHAFRFADNVHTVHCHSELPPALERIALASQAGNRAWLAWSDGARTWFVTGEHAADRAEARALRTHFHADDGRRAASATWTLRPDGRWQLCIC